MPEIHYKLFHKYLKDLNKWFKVRSVLNKLGPDIYN